MPSFNPLYWQSHIDTFHFHLCRIVSWFTLLMVIQTFLIVLLRYGFNLGWIAMQESVMYMHALVFLLGAAHTLRVNEHVRVDIFYRRLSPRQQSLVDIVGVLTLLMPVNFFIMWISWDYVVMSWELLERSREAGGLPFVFFLKTLILLFAITMNLQGLAELLRNIMSYKLGEKT